MKKIVCFVYFVVLGLNIYSQTYTVQGDTDFDYEFTIITKTQFDRIIKAHETTDTAVHLSFFDEIESEKSRVIKGSRPTLNGYYYLSVKMIPKNESARNIASFYRAWVRYGNAGIGFMNIRFLSTSWISGAISLQYNWNEYVRQYNQLIKLVNGE